MAIKVTGTTVINDSREVENITDMNRFIQKPEITNPVNQSVDNNVGIIIEGSLYSPLYTNDERLYREFEIDLDSGDFSNPQRSIQIDSDNSNPLDPTLDPDETYKARIRDVSVNGTVSEYSNVVVFTTVNVTVDTPTVTIKTFGPQNQVDETPEISATSAFSVTGDTDTHESTDWEIVRTSDSAVVFSSFNDTSNLTSITVPEGFVEDGNTEYIFKARYRGTTYGASDYGSVTATTLQDFDGLNYIGQPARGGFYMGTVCAAGNCYSVFVAPNSTGETACQWKTERTITPGTDDFFDGHSNTYDHLTSSLHPAGNWTRTRTINGFSDWYLPAVDEQGAFETDFGAGTTNDPLPDGEKYLQARYWSSTSTDDNAQAACANSFTGGGSVFRCFTNRVRAVRREPI